MSDPSRPPRAWRRVPPGLGARTMAERTSAPAGDEAPESSVAASPLTCRRCILSLAPSSKKSGSDDMIRPVGTRGNAGPRRSGRAEAGCPLCAGPPGSGVSRVLVLWHRSFTLAFHEERSTTGAGGFLSAGRRGSAELGTAPQCRRARPPPCGAPGLPLVLCPAAGGSALVAWQDWAGGSGHTSQGLAPPPWGAETHPVSGLLREPAASRRGCRHPAPRPGAGVGASSSAVTLRLCANSHLLLVGGSPV